MASGLRNPFRMAVHPETDEVWFGDVGWVPFEEVNRLPHLHGGEVVNYGWPCYEGDARHNVYDSLDLDICEDLYDEGQSAVEDPAYFYEHGEPVVEDDGCVDGGASISGVAFEFYPDGPYPPEYDGALFFADYSRDCIWVMRAGADGQPDPDLVEPFVSPARNPVELQMMAGELYYLDFDGGTLRRVVATVPPDPTTCPAGQLLAEYFDNQTLSGAAVVTRCEVPPNHVWGVDPPVAGVNADSYSVRWTGQDTFAAGTYDFAARADDGIRVWVDGVQIIDGWHDQAPTTFTASRTLTAGPHNVQIEYYEAFGGAVAQVSWALQGGGAACPVGQYRADYFANQTFTGPPAVSRCEAQINNTWGTGAPAAGLPADGYTVRWTGRHVFPGGAATFTARSDDGIRARLDGQPVLEMWREQAPTTMTATRPVTAGEHEVVVEYFEAAGGAVAQFSWQSGNQPPVPTITAPPATPGWRVGQTLSFAGGATDPEDGPLPASALSWQLVMHHCPTSCHAHPIQTWTGVASGSFVAPDHDFPSYLELQLVATDSGGAQDVTTRRLDPQTVDLTFTSTPPGLSLAVGASSATTPFTRTVIVGSATAVSATSPQTQGAQSYAFSTWSDGGAQAHTITAPATATTYTATYQTDGGVPTACPTGQLLAEYWNNRDATGLPVLSRCETTVAHQWGTGSPAPGINADLFAVRWTGRYDLAAGTYDFTARADDGIRVLVDGALVVNGWFDQAPTTYTGSTTLTAGLHDVRIEYYEAYGGAMAEASWAPRTAPPTCAAPQLTATYYANQTLTGTPVLTRCEDAIANQWGVGSPAPSVPAENFSARWTTNPTLAAGTYRFTARADDGVRVRVDGQLVVDGWVPQAPTTYVGEVALTAGAHEIVVEYFEASGGAVAQVSWALQGGAGPGCAAGQFTAEYFGNTTLAGLPAVTRCETAIANDWGTAPPVAGIPADVYSVRWTGTFTFAGGATTFTARSDDGIRVRVDGVLLIDRWVDQAPTTVTGTATLTPGAHQVVVEYYEAYGGAVAHASWAP